MKGILKKIDNTWVISYVELEWTADGGEIIHEAIVELDPFDAKDVELIRDTEITLENKEVIFEFRETNNIEYGKLTKYTPLSSNIQADLGYKCTVCEKVTNVNKPMCNDCFNALKGLILERRAKPI